MWFPPLLKQYRLPKLACGILLYVSLLPSVTTLIMAAQVKQTIDYGFQPKYIYVWHFNNCCRK